MPLSVLVVGAGIGGLSTALALRRANHRVTILEQRHEKKEAGYGIEIPSNATRILKSLGFDLPSVRGCRQTGIDFFKADTDTLYQNRFEERPSDDDAPNISVHRQDYYKVLKQLAQDGQGPGTPVVFRFGCKVFSYDSADGGVTLDTEEKLEADIVVAADGGNSTAHKWVIGELRLPVYTGLSNVRFVLPTEVVLQCPGMERFVTRGRKGRACMYINSEGVTIMHYPCREGTLQNFGIFDTDLSDEETTNSSLSNTEIVMRRVSGMHHTIISLAKMPKEEDMYLWRITDRDPLPKLHKDKLVLIGDACHPMQPMMGQGAAQAVEDAAVLGVVMEGAVSVADVKARLQLWEDLRKPRAGAVQLMSRTKAGGKGWTNANDKEKALKFFPNSGLPRGYGTERDKANADMATVTRAEMNVYAHHHDVLREARAALDRRGFTSKASYSSI